MGLLETQKDLRPYKHLIARIEGVMQDPRYGFMFGKMMIEDNLAEILKQIFRIPVSGKPITIIQLTGLPEEIINVVVSILARLAFDLSVWSDGKVPITLVCEEAHRYVPREKEAGVRADEADHFADCERRSKIRNCAVRRKPASWRH